ncbi:hypothetical protein GF406_20415 [candidate division KSB1 bacterium]|jgi:predicted anti-sigma-YlaC factor YlaD|nr:hypothetical protein [candidate division KSB1 bacterium]
MDPIKDAKDMHCHNILDRLCDDLAEDIDSELCQELKYHLETCESCRSQLGSVRKTVQLFRCLQEKEVPSIVHSRLLTLLNLPTS